MTITSIGCSHSFTFLNSSPDVKFQILRFYEVGTERESWVKGYTKEFRLVGCFDRHVPKGKYSVRCCGAPTADDQTLGLGWFETDSPALSPFV